MKRAALLFFGSMLFLFGFLLFFSACSSPTPITTPTSTSVNGGDAIPDLIELLSEKDTIILHDGLANTEKQYTGDKKAELINIINKIKFGRFPDPQPISGKAGYFWLIKADLLAIYFQGRLLTYM